MLCTQQIVNVLCQIKKNKLQAVCKSTNVQVLMRLTRRRAHQTESNRCDILGSFFRKVVQAADYCLGRGKLMGSLLRKWGQLAKAQLGQHCNSTSGC